MLMSKLTYTKYQVGLGCQIVSAVPPFCAVGPPALEPAPLRFFPAIPGLWDSIAHVICRPAVVASGRLKHSPGPPCVSAVRQRRAGGADLRLVGRAAVPPGVCRHMVLVAPLRCVSCCLPKHPCRTAVYTATSCQHPLMLPLYEPMRMLAGVPTLNALMFFIVLFFPRLFLQDFDVFCAPYIRYIIQEAKKVGCRAAPVLMLHRFGQFTRSAHCTVPWCLAVAVSVHRPSQPQRLLCGTHRWRSVPLAHATPFHVFCPPPVLPRPAHHFTHRCSGPAH